MTGFAAHGGASRGLPVALPLARPRSQRRHWYLHWSTPARIRTEAVAVAALACCLAALTAVLLVQLRGEFGAIGTAPSQSDGAFTAYDAALSSVIAINSTAFTSAVAGGEADAGTGSLAFAVLAGLLVAALTCAGVRPRLAEYR